jgi:hypothetical protein
MDGAAATTCVRDGGGPARATWAGTVPRSSQSAAGARPAATGPAGGPPDARPLLAELVDDLIVYIAAPGQRSGEPARAAGRDRAGPAALAADPAIKSVAARHGVTASQIALAWLLAHYDRMLLIPGTSSVAHLEENLAAGGIQLGDDDLATLGNATHIGGPGF